MTPLWKRPGFLVVWLLGWFGGDCGSVAEPFQLEWMNQVLTVKRTDLPGGALKILYLEAFLKTGAHDRDWGQSKIPHTTTLMDRSADAGRLSFRTQVGTNVEVMHEIRARSDSLDLTFEFRNQTDSKVDLQWFQPACIRVDGFTGRDQVGYTSRSFIFTKAGLTTLDRVRRTTEALYRGGQVYVPETVRRADANPRPICKDPPINGLIGCFSADDRWILATASDRTHELFEGVYVCLHSDPHIGGLEPRERKQVRQKVYLVPNDPEGLLKRYRKDFPDSEKSW